MKTDFPFQLTLNTSTLRPFALSVVEQIRAAAEAGFSGIELWVRDILTHVESGGSPEEIRGVADAEGIQIVNGIAFFKWTDAGPAVRTEGLEQGRREIDLLAQIGCSAVAAPPTGNVASLSMEDIGANFATLVPIGRDAGVEPILEFWGRAPVLHSIAEATQVLTASGVEAGRMLLDLYHMYTGGSEVGEVPPLGAQIGLVHINDYPADPARALITDAERVMPGDGVGPVKAFLNALAAAGFSGPLSVELFRKDYGEADAVATARLAARKTLACWNRN